MSFIWGLVASVAEQTNDEGKNCFLSKNIIRSPQMCSRAVTADVHTTSASPFAHLWDSMVGRAATICITSLECVLSTTPR